MPRLSMHFDIVASEITPLRTPANKNPSRTKGRVCSITANASDDRDTLKSIVRLQKGLFQSDSGVNAQPHFTPPPVNVNTKHPFSTATVILKYPQPATVRVFASPPRISNPAPIACSVLA